MDKEFTTIPTEHFMIEGRSRVGHETLSVIEGLEIRD